MKVNLQQNPGGIGNTPKPFMVQKLAVTAELIGQQAQTQII